MVLKNLPDWRSRMAQPPSSYCWANLLSPETSKRLFCTVMLTFSLLSPGSSNNAVMVLSSRFSCKSILSDDFQTPAAEGPGLITDLGLSVPEVPNSVPRRRASGRSQSRRGLPVTRQSPGSLNHRSIERSPKRSDQIVSKSGSQKERDIVVVDSCYVRIRIVEIRSTLVGGR